ncbi:MAG TPA: segregation/condensation protein A [bacterium]|nr:segregation/condensation protein A [bacterium]
MAERLNFNLELFEGPLDLLLHLIKLNEIEIADIPIAEITKQYMEYLNLISELNFEVASEFIIMAATLMRIKARLLLPQSELFETEEDWEDPRQELVERLLEYKKYKELSIHLTEKLEAFQDTFSRDFTLLDDTYKKGEIHIVHTDLFNLLSAYKKILSRLANRLPEEIEGEKITIEEKEEHIITKLRYVNFVRFSELFREARSKNEIVLTFMALLELLRIGNVKVQQENMFGEIYIYKNESDNSSQNAVNTENECENLETTEIYNN